MECRLSHNEEHTFCEREHQLTSKFAIPPVKHTLQRANVPFITPDGATDKVTGSDMTEKLGQQTLRFPCEFRLHDDQITTIESDEKYHVPSSLGTLALIPVTR
ncbi:hypothetical protein OUZ56_032154 [Daphnia magna]|uniref:Uncharacterized protein n=1 Tax=Daphnia magna TaxID=35525 RepID=A0ABQ9ZWB1_9CRUS|nr:hypothetical protein OUZ56_032154 [Daphnia magna]